MGAVGKFSQERCRQMCARGLQLELPARAPGQLRAHGEDERSVWAPAACAGSRRSPGPRGWRLPARPGSPGARCVPAALQGRFVPPFTSGTEVDGAPIAM